MPTVIQSVLGSTESSQHRRADNNSFSKYISGSSITFLFNEEDSAQPEGNHGRSDLEDAAPEITISREIHADQDSESEYDSDASCSDENQVTNINEEGLDWEDLELVDLDENDESLSGLDEEYGDIEADDLSRDGSTSETVDGPREDAIRGEAKDGGNGVNPSNTHAINMNSTDGDTAAHCHMFSRWFVNAYKDPNILPLKEEKIPGFHLSPLELLSFLHLSRSSSNAQSKKSVMDTFNSTMEFIQTNEPERDFGVKNLYKSRVSQLSKVGALCVKIGIFLSIVIWLNSNSYEICLDRCPQNCKLFYGPECDNQDFCECGQARYKYVKEGRKTIKVAAASAYYFSLIALIRMLFMSRRFGNDIVAHDEHLRKHHPRLREEQIFKDDETMHDCWCSEGWLENYIKPQGSEYDPHNLALSLSADGKLVRIISKSITSLVTSFGQRICRNHSF